jgi:hypothetical protein
MLRDGRFAWDPYERKKLKEDHSKYYSYKVEDEVVMATDEFLGFCFMLMPMGPRNHRRSLVRT